MSRMKVSLFAASAALSLFTGAAGVAAENAAGGFGSWGFDLAGRDVSIEPGDDFFGHANGNYQKALVIPADRSSYSPRTANNVLIEQRIHEMLESASRSSSPAATIEGKVGAFYASFMDEAHVESLGAKPLADDLAAIRAAGSHDALARLMGRTNESFHASLFAVDVQVDAKDPSRYAVFAGQAGLGLPDRDYYLDAEFAAQKAAYERYAAELLKLVGWPDAAARAKDIAALETRIAAASWPKTDQRNPDLTYNPMTPADLERLAPGFSWSGFLAGAGLGDAGQVIVAEKSAFPKLAAIYAETPIEVLQAWAAFRLADNAAPYLSRGFADAWFELRGRTLSGQPAQPVRWKRAVRAVSGGDGSSFERADTFGTLGFAVGELYTARYFPPEAKAKINALVDDLKAAFRARIQRLDWMGPSTKAEALKKLDAYKVKVGYPDKPRDYSAVAIRRDDLYGNVLRAAAADWAYRSKRLGGPVDRDEWLMTPQMNNAYNGSLTDIVFSAAILMPPIFDPNADPAINYGAVGGVIGHELTHGFDDQGRKYDAQGRLRDWWTAADAKGFEERAAKLGRQYSAFEPLPGLHVNGDLTMGENIADLGGLTMALEAYRMSLKGKPAPVLDGLTGEQRVFLGWAQAWRGKLRDDALRQLVVSDPHSPRQYRVNGPVRNIDDWYAAFGVKPGRTLYLAPAERVRIW